MEMHDEIRRVLYLNNTELEAWNSHSGPPLLKMAIISDQSIPRRSKVINPAEVVGRCNVFFDTRLKVLHSLESLDPIIIGDFGGVSGMGDKCTYAYKLFIKEVDAKS